VTARLTIALALAAALVVTPAAGRDQLHAQRAAAYRIIVHPTNSVTQLRRAQIRDYFLKRRADWEPGLPAAPVDLTPKLAVRTLFSREILELSPTAVTSYWMQEIFAGSNTPPPVMSTVAAVLAYVASTPGAIGYVPGDTPTDGVRIVTVLP